MKRRDGYTDVADFSSAGEVIVFYNNGLNPPDWEFQTLTSSFSGGKSILIRDMDMDGDYDLLGIASDIDQIAWRENNWESLND